METPIPFTEAVIAAFKANNQDVAQYVTIYDVKQVLTPEQSRELKAATLERPFHFKMFRTLIETGMTVDEIVNLKYGNIDVAKNQISIATSSVWEPRSRYATRQIPVDATLIDLLLSNPGARDAYIFSVRGGKPYRKESVIYSIHQYTKKCPTIRYVMGTREIRRTYAYNEILKGTPLRVLVERLGHKDATITLRFMFSVNVGSVAKIVNATTTISQ